jgi:hypothetical protein
VLQDSMPVSARSDEWREDRAAVLHSLAVAAISAGDDTAAEVTEPVRTTSTCTKTALKVQ